VNFSGKRSSSSPLGQIIDELGQRFPGGKYKGGRRVSGTAFRAFEGSHRTTEAGAKQSTSTKAAISRH